MAYVLHEAYNLEGFYGAPFFAVSESLRRTVKLSRAEFTLALRCDGSADSDALNADEERLAADLVRRGILREVGALREAGALREVDCVFHDFRHAHTAQVAITGRCNLHCKHCLAAAGSSNVATQLTLEECRKIFADMVEARIFNLWITGGEPMVHPQFREILCAAAEYGLRVNRIYTNASLVDDATLDFLEAHGMQPEFVVSFDGIGTHDWMRNSTGAEQRTLDAIDLIRSRGFRVCASINVNGVTAPVVIESCRHLVLNHGIRRLHPIFTSPTPRWHDFAQDNELLDIGQYYDLMIELLRVSRLEKWPAMIDVIHMPHLHLQPNAQAAELLRNPPAARPSRHIMSSCKRACDVVFIASDGRVLFCSALEGESRAHGIMTGDDVNVKKRPLKDIMGSSAYLEPFKLTIADLWKTDPACRDCAWVQICCGGCPVYTLERQIWDCGNPLCQLYKGGYATKYLTMLEETV